MTYIPLTLLAQEQVSEQLGNGQYAIDATVGNGYDTVFLARSVGAEGSVFGFDIQQQALTETQRQLAAARLDDRVTLIRKGHENMTAQIPSDFHGQIAAIMFNLGYLPGSDKNVVTQPSTTVLAIKAASRLLANGGIMSILVYRGHGGALNEADRVARLLGSLDSRRFRIKQYKSPGPWLYVVRKN